MVISQLKYLAESNVINGCHIFDDSLNQGLTMAFIHVKNGLLYVTTARGDNKVYKSLNSLKNDYRYIIGCDFQQLQVIK